MIDGPDVLHGGPAARRPRWWWAVGLLAAAVVVVFVLRGGDAAVPEVAGPVPTTSSGGSAATPAPTATAPTVDPAYAVGGSLPPNSLPHSGGTATQAARTVANSYCDRIDSWRIAVLASADDFATTTLQLTPSGTAYRTVRITLTLTWVGDHYDWAGDRRDLEACP